MVRKHAVLGVDIGIRRSPGQGGSHIRSDMGLLVFIHFLTTPGDHAQVAVYN
jgi:hypothetical protein